MGFWDLGNDAGIGLLELVFDFGLGFSFLVLGLDLGFFSRISIARGVYGRVVLGLFLYVAAV